MILTGDSLSTLRTLRARSVQCCVTSPPYWGLRDYGTAKWEGGRVGCRHIDPNGPVNAPSAKSTLTTNGGRGPLPGDKYQHDRQAQFRGICGKCGARRVDAQLGLEATPEEYVSRLVEIFREVRRVLKDDGTLWLNLGDCYATGGGKFNSPGGGKQGQYWKGFRGEHAHDPKRNAAVIPVGPHLQPNRMPIAGLKPKDLVGIPWRVAFALQADGWYLRSDIIWHKPNPMPESVTDRPTKAHEYLFLLAKSERYFYDTDAVKEPAATDWLNRGGSLLNATGWHTAARGHDTTRRDNRSDCDGASRNRRSVWTVATKPFKGAHFATFPPKLIEPCILAGSRKGDRVLDPFAGAGTTGLVAQGHGRKFLGIELNPAYVDMANARLNTIAVKARAA